MLVILNYEEKHEASYKKWGGSIKLVVSENPELFDVILDQFLKSSSLIEILHVNQMSDSHLPDDFEKNKIHVYIEKSIPMTALWCPAFGNHG